MTKPSHPRPEAQARPEIGKREDAAQRLLRQKAAVIATQVDLKREAAQRRARKGPS
jgi:hypothetical protein